MKYCYDFPMENEIETVWSQNNIIFKASPPYSNSFSESESLGVRKKSELGTQTLRQSSLKVPSKDPRTSHSTQDAPIGLWTERCVDPWTKIFGLGLASEF